MRLHLGRSRRASAHRQGSGRRGGGKPQLSEGAGAPLHRRRGHVRLRFRCSGGKSGYGVPSDGLRRQRKHQFRHHLPGYHLYPGRNRRHSRPGHLPQGNPGGYAPGHHRCPPDRKRSALSGSDFPGTDGGNHAPPSARGAGLPGSHGLRHQRRPAGADSGHAAVPGKGGKYRLPANPPGRQRR